MPFDASHYIIPWQQVCLSVFLTLCLYVHACSSRLQGSGSSLAARALLQQLLTLAVEAQRISQQAAHLAQLAAHQHQCTQQQFTQQKQLSPQQQRSCMQDASSSQQAMPPSSMLSPPQQGSSTARTTARQSLAGAVAGASGSTAGYVLDCVAAEARLAREAGLRAATLCSEGAALFPSDILQAARCALMYCGCSKDALHCQATSAGMAQHC